MCPGIGEGAWLRCLPTPGGGVQGHLQYPIPISLKAAVGFLTSCIFWVHLCPTGHACSYFDCNSFFVFVPGGGGVSRYKHCSTAKKGPRSQRVSFVCGYSQYLHFFYFKRIFKFISALLYGNPLYKGHVLLFFTSEPRRVLIQKRKEKKKHQGFVKHVSGG